MSRKLIIHIGIEKTGSTTIQNILHDTGVPDLPQIIYPRWGLKSKHHYSLARWCGFSFGTTISSRSKNDQMLKEVQKFQQLEDKDILISSEHFDIYPSVDKIQTLLGLFRNREKHVIVVFRNQLDYVYSLYSEGIKWGVGQDIDSWLYKIFIEGKLSFHQRLIWEILGCKLWIYDYDSIKNEILRPIEHALSRIYDRTVQYRSNTVLNARLPFGFLESMRREFGNIDRDKRSILVRRLMNEIDYKSVEKELGAGGVVRLNERSQKIIEWSMISNEILGDRFATSASEKFFIRDLDKIEEIDEQHINHWREVVRRHVNANNTGI